MKQRIRESTWAEIRTAYAAGIGLREMARNLGIPAGTVLARAKREGWTAQVEQAKAKALPSSGELPDMKSVMQSAAASMAERGQRHIERMAGIAEKVTPHMEAMHPGAIFERIEKVDRFDRLARRTYGLDDPETRGHTVVNIAFLGRLGFNQPPVAESAT